MDVTYEAKLKFVTYLKVSIEEDLPHLDVDDLENRLQQFTIACNALEEAKNQCVDAMLANEVERNKALDWAKTQKPIIKNSLEFKQTLLKKIEDLKQEKDLKMLQNKQQFEETISTMQIEARKRVAEAEQKINAAVQGDLTKLIIERQDTEKEFFEQQGISRHQNHFSGTPNVKLQKLSITPFGGEILDWVRFNSQFSTEIDNCEQLDEVSKFNYLLSLTKGRPREEISGLPHDSVGYKKAMEILRQKYGKDSVVFKNLVFELENLPAIKHVNQKREIQDFSRRFSKTVRILTTMGKISSVDGNVHSIFARLGPIRENLAAANDDWESWSLTRLSEELEKYVDRNNLHSKDYDQKQEQHSQHNEFKRTQRNEYNHGRYNNYKDKAFLNDENTKIKRSCTFCDFTNHESKNCLKVIDISKRRDIVKNKHLCFVCLRHGHIASNCKAKPCGKCSQRHHITLCTQEKSTIPPKTQITEETEKTMTSINKLQVGTIHATAIVEIKGVKARVMLDTGSSRSHIGTNLLGQLNIKPSRVENCNIEQLNGTIKKKMEIYKLKMKSLFNDFELDIEVANCGKGVITYLPNYNIRNLKMKYKPLQNLLFSDENEEAGSQLPVDILLGTKDYNSIRSARAPIICGDRQNLIAEYTKLGWVLSGGISAPNIYEKGFLTSEEQFERMTKLDIIGVTDREEQRYDFHEDFLSNLKQTENGRYVAALPWKRDIIALPDNKELALCRLRKNTIRLSKLNKLNEYDMIMKEQIASGILEEVTESATSKNVHYIPHQAVIKEDAQSTKLRVVFDCSSKINSEQPSLNDCLETGPPLQPKLFDIIMRSRTHKYLLTGDIKKAFHQIMLQEGDTDMQRLFWYGNLKDQDIKAYKFTRVIFGCNSSPYILGATLQKHFAKYMETYPETAKCLSADTYVDDIIAGSNNVGQLKQFKKEAITILGEAQMELHKFKSNIPELEDQTDEVSNEKDDHPTYADVTSNTKADETKLLGIHWNKVNDTISIKFKGAGTTFKALTKRIILSYVHGIFDILGLISPITVIGKVIFSKTCMKGLRWDERVPPDIETEWHKYIKELAITDAITFPRSILASNAQTLELHGFCDASLTATCAVVYIISKSPTETRQELLVSKNRVAPKETSVPRLELIGAVMLSKLIAHVKENLNNVEFSKCIAWSDSTTVLYWLKSRGTYSRFVRNRVDKITEQELDWKYIPTADNPADIGSRGCYPRELSKLWFNGPQWISKEHEWPNQQPVCETEESKTEVAKTKIKERALIEVDDASQESALNKLLEKPYYKMLRTTAYIYRFVRREHSTATLTACEIQNAENFWIKEAQKEIDFEKEANLLQSEDGIYKMTGRIQGYNPILIPRSHPLAKSLALNAHRKTLHGGASTIICDLRKRFWIPQLRSIAKSVVYNCEKCKRYRVKPIDPPKTGLMPEFRTEYTPPFTVVGVDFAGPLRYRLETYEANNDCPHDGKCYIALFTCATTRAVYIKLCRTAGQEEFQRVFKEFVTRRGRPRMMVSDNAKTFEATSEWLKILKDEDLNNYITKENITWRFNLSRAPWWGGFFERLIGIMKRALSKSIGKGFLRFHELESILYDIENFLNNRPLTYQGEDFERPALTPNSFLRENDTSTLEEDLEKIPEDTNISKRIAYIQRCKNELRYRWQNEYLHALQERHSIKQGGQRALPTVGEIVLLKDDVKDKAQWRIARVLKQLKGPDMQIRGFQLKLGNGYIIQRPIQLVCPLELKAEEGEVNDIQTVPTALADERPKRKAKEDAKAKISALSKEEDNFIDD